MKHSNVILLLGLSVLTACGPLGLATGAGATLGLSAAQEGGVNRAVSDARIQAQINNAWFQSNIDIFTKLDLTVNQGRVLVTGVVQDPQHRVEAIRLIWNVKGVEQVINEIQVDKSAGFSGFVQDNWITTRLRTKLTFDKEIQSLNFNIDTVKGSVYLLGVAQDQVELNKVIEAARSVSGVRQVVSYVKIAGEDFDDNLVRLDELPENDLTAEPASSTPQDLSETRNVDDVIWNDVPVEQQSLE